MRGEEEKTHFLHLTVNARASPRQEVGSRGSLCPLFHIQKPKSLDSHLPHMGMTDKGIADYRIENPTSAIIHHK